MAGVAYPVHTNKFKIGTNGTESTTDQMVMPADLENFSPAIDGQTVEWFAMDAEGWAKNMVTGKKFSIDFKGKRSVGDPGNDYIAGLAMKMGNDVLTKFSWEMVSGAKLEGLATINVTTPGGGDTTALDALEFTLTLYGKPTFTPALN